MKRIGTISLACVAALFVASVVFATPSPTTATFNLRVFNDCPSSILTYGATYPSLIFIDDAKLDCNPGWANLHNWRFSEDGINDAVFMNSDQFRVSAILTITGTADGEAGLQISPWWSKQVDGRFNVRTSDGEIACFGGRLPFYSFTGSYGLHYAKGNPIYLEMTYAPRLLSAVEPATIVYKLTYLGNTYSSGPLYFDQGNVAEGAVYGNWGILNDARVGGHLQALIQAGNANAELRGEWTQVGFESGATPTMNTTWGKLKSLYR